MAVAIRSLDAAGTAAWDAFVLAHPDGTFFHRAAWATIIEQAFGHRTFYAFAERDGAITGVLPLARVKTLLFGDTLISVPFCVYGGPLAADPETAAALSAHAAALLRQTGASAVEFRFRGPNGGTMPTVSRDGQAQDRHDPAEGRHGPAEDRHDPAEGRHGPAEGRHGLAEDRHGPAEDRHGPAQDRHDPAQDRHDPAEGCHDPAESRHGPAEGRHDPAEGRHDPAEDRHGPAQDRHDPTESRHDPAEGRHDPVESRHGPARPGHLNQNRAAIGGPDEPGHDGERETGAPIVAAVPLNGRDSGSNSAGLSGGSNSAGLSGGSNGAVLNGGLNGAADNGGTGSDWQARPDLYVTFRKPIDTDNDKNLKAIPRKQRAMVRKGIQNNLRSVANRDAATLHGIYAESVRNLGTPVFSRRYFTLLAEVFGNDCDVVTVLDGDTAIAAVMNFYFRDEVLPYYGGGTAAARQRAGNDFMYWEVMRRAADRGCRLFDFGRSKIGTGSHDFKKNWGFVPEPLGYRYMLAPGASIPDHNPLNPKYRLFIAGWKQLPLAVANAIGPSIVRGLG